MIGVKKKVLIISIALISVMLFSTFGLLIRDLLDITSKQENVLDVNTEVSDISEVTTALVTKNDVDFVFSWSTSYVGGGECSKDEYNQYTTFGIDSGFGLMGFSKSVAEGYDFSGKSVFLLDNIIYRDVWGNYVPIGAKMWNGTTPTTKYNGKKPFKGTFDGQGFRVNFSAESQSAVCVVESRDDDSGDLHLGFFAQLQAPAVVQNLRINNFTISNYSNQKYTLIGGVAGYGNLYDSSGTITIKNCLVKNLAVTINDSDTVAGGLVGYSKMYGDMTLNLEQCAVDTFKVNTNVKCDSAGGLIAKTYMQFTGILGDFYYGKLNILNCLIKDFSVTGSSAEYIANLSPARGIIFASTGYDNSNVEYPNSYFSYNISKSVVQTTNTYTNVMISNTISECGNLGIFSDIITSATGEGLSCSYIGGAKEPEIWYRATGYNNSYPYLRQFLDWQTIDVFPANNQEMSVNISSFEIPTDATLSSAGDVSSEPTITVYDRQLTATPKECYEMEKWIFGTSGPYGNPYYCAYAQRIQRTISFAGCANVSFETSNLSTYTNYQIYCGYTLTLKINETYQKQGKYKSVTFSFTDVGGVERSITYYIDDNKNREYCISGLNISIQPTTSSGSNIYYNIHEDVTSISVYSELKVYNPTFQ